MCGIAGVLAFNKNGRKDFSRLPAAIEKLNLRGPDRQKIWENEKFCAGHTRLSIIDLSEASDQPFVSKDGRYVMLLNGEIFNFRELRKELEGLGEIFHTDGDVEVALRCFMSYGKDCLNKFNGFFAFAVYDTQKEELFLARDRFGIKPLLVYSDSDRLIFASEMKAMLEFSIPRNIDMSVVSDYFQFTYCPEPETLIKGVLKLPAAKYAIVKSGNYSEFSYYDIPESVFEGDYNDAKSALSELLNDAIRLRLISDVPLGSFLSGGLDSSIISVLAARQEKNMEVFTIGFPDHPYYDETKYAREIADMHALNHRVIPVREDDFLRALPQVLDYIDEPFADSSSIAVHVLSAFVKKHVTVALSGDAADEIFGGYRKHRAALSIMNASGVKKTLMKSLSHIPGQYSRAKKTTDLLRKMQRLGNASKLSGNELYRFLAAFMTDESLNNLFSNYSNIERKDIKNIIGQIDPNDFNTFLRADMKMVLCGDMLRKIDMMSMANSLEVRPPFLDYRIINLAFSFPSKWKVNGKKSKKILMDTFSDFIPPSIINRPKHGFEVPMGKWMEGALLKQMKHEWLEDDFIKSQGVFKPETIRFLLEEVKKGNASTHQSVLWSLIVFQNWWKKYLS